MTAMKQVLPNCLTALRILLAIPIVMAVNQDLKLALILFCVAALTDAFDGRLARRWSATSKLGAILDPLADKIIYLVTLYALSYSLPIFWIFVLTFPLEATLMAIRFEPLKSRFKTIVQAPNIVKERVYLQSAAIVIIMVGVLVDYQLLMIEGIIIASLAILYSWASLMSHFEQKIKTA